MPPFLSIPFYSADTPNGLKSPIAGVALTMCELGAGVMTPMKSVWDCFSIAVRKQGLQSGIFRMKV